jgi:hypothetical protein
MSSGNAYLKKQQAVNQGFLDLGEQIATQKMWDYIQIVLRDPKVMGKDTFGPKRLAKLYAAMKEAKDEYHIAFTADKEADYYQEKLDGQLRAIWKEKTLSFYERYPDLKRMKYDKAKKGWV